MDIDLSTTTTDGLRKWVYPILAPGRWWKRRRLFAWGLIAWLLVAPWLKVGGHQAVFFDLINRRIHFLGLTFWVNEFMVILFFILLVLSTIVMLTVILGRVFCGWACPITVFMEFVFRPIEIWLEGSGAKQKEFRSKPLSERLLPFVVKWVLFVAIAVILGNTFVAYLMGSHRMLDLIAEGPSAHFGPFMFMLISSGVILGQYGWFREQICLFVCPYGRLQSVMLDKDSLIVGYDKNRGEPRGKLGSTTGDCIDCKLCVRVCPTGIDIRNGLQLECVHCTQCIDACDSIMDKINKPQGLIRYQTEAEVEGKKTRFLRPRLAIYSVVVVVASAFLVGYTSMRKDFRATIHRQSSSRLFEIDADDKIVNPVHIHLTNMSEKNLDIRFESISPSALEVIAPEGVVHLKSLEKTEVQLIVRLPHSEFHENFGLADVKFKAVSQDGQENELELRAVGPAN